MLGHFLLSFARNFRANTTISLINVLSLAAGLMVFISAYLYVERELSYDREWPNAERVHRLVLEQRNLPGSPDGFFTNVNARAFPALLDYFPEQIDEITRVASSPVMPEGGGGGFSYSLSFVDSSFARILQLEAMEGNLEYVLQNPGLVAISESTAETLGDTGRVGQRLTLESTFAGGKQEFEVGAIYRLPALSTLDFPMLTAIGDHARALFVAPYGPFWEGSVNIWLTLAEGGGTADFNARMPSFIDTAVTAFDESLPTGESISEHLFYRFQPIRDMHLNPVGSETLNTVRFGDRDKILTFAAVGVLVLLVGCANSASLSLAGAMNRRREIGIRKACGASRGVVLGQYLGESVLLALIAGSFALALEASIHAPLMALLNIRGEFGLGAGNVAVLMGIAGLMGLGNGAYPAFVLSNVRPQLVLKTDVASGTRRSSHARSLLLGAQFSLAVVFLATSFALYAQLATARSQPLGFDHRNLLWITTQDRSSAPDTSAMLNQLRSLPGVVGAAATAILPNQNMPLTLNTANLVRKREQVVEIQATQVTVYDGLLDLLGIPLVAGRTLEGVRDGFPLGVNIAASTRTNSIMLNRRATEVLGFASPEVAVGETIFQRLASRDGSLTDRPAFIVGVVEDSLLMSVRRRPVPELYRTPAEIAPGASMLVRYDTAAEDDIERRITQLYQEFGASPFFLFVEDRIEGAFLQERSESRLLLMAAAFALFLSCIGLYGLAAATMARSVKEIGVRRVLGASVGAVVALFLWRFSRPVLLANIVAWPVAAWFVLRWIQQFPYQLDLNWMPLLFLSASLLVLLVAWLAVVGVTIRAASRAPVQSLRYE